MFSSLTAHLQEDLALNTHTHALCFPSMPCEAELHLLAEECDGKSSKKEVELQQFPQFA